MTTYALTGATGQLGRIVVNNLLETVPAADVVAIVRDGSKATDLAALGVQVRIAAYEAPAALAEALTGVDRLLLVSGSEPGHRVAQHGNVIDAAVAAGVSHIVYTSAPHADDTVLILAPEHAATEELLRSSGLSHTILRNNWYHENYLGSVQQAAASGVLVGSAGEGLVASASRSDFAAAAAIALTDTSHDGKLFELGGDVAWTMPDLASAIAAVSGRPVSYQNLNFDDHVEALVGAGLPAETAGFLAGLDGNIAAGTLAGPTGELSALIGRPTTPLVEGLRAA